MTDEKNITHFIIDFIQREFENCEIDLSRSLQDLIPSSMIYVHLIVSLEKEFQIEFDDNKLDYRTFQTLKELASYVNKKMLLI
ncbi:MAG: phosphopantetheine-binding protein [Spirochaetales bacterium]|nr:phosphopantetheine-binding protein [Spirochaetales bacterium]